MNLGKLKRAGWADVVISVLAPLVVLAAVIIPGRIYCLSKSQSLAAREACIEQVPVMEVQLAEARRVLREFTETEAGVDKASELTLVAEKASQEFGFTTRAANVTKQASPDTERWADYQLMINGGGSLKSIIGMLDYLENPVHRFQAKQVVLKANSIGASSQYEGSVVLSTRVLQPVPAASKPKRAITTAQAMEQSERFNRLTIGLKSWLSEKRDPLLASNSSRTTVNPIAQSLKPSRVFVLNGIARDSRNPLAMTDRGVFGIGEKVDGYTIVDISNDQVILSDSNGRREVVTLY